MLKHDVLALHEDVLRHGIADAAGVVSHSEKGQPFPAAVRLKAIPQEVRARIVETLKEAA